MWRSGTDEQPRKTEDMMSIEKSSKYLGLLAQYAAKHKNINTIDCSVIQSKLISCPCSTKYHGAYPGGLVDHLLNVAESATQLYGCFESSVRDVVTIDQLMFCALVHDLGKLGNVTDDFFLVNPDVSKREKEPYIVNKDMVSIPHEIRTIYWLNHLGMGTLTEEELQAICYHAGPYTPGYLEFVRKESPLLILLHAADNLTTKLIER